MELSHARSWSPESGNSRKVSGSLLRDSAVCSEIAHTSAVRRRRRGQAEDAVRAARALSLVQMGDKPSKVHPFAPGNLATMEILIDPSRRPPIPRRALSEEVRVAEPAEPFVLDSMEFLICLRKARPGAAVGPSGMTSDHLFPVLESEGDSESFAKVASMLAVGNVPNEIIEAIRHLEEVGHPYDCEADFEES